MAEADGIGAAAASTGRDDQVGGLVETLCTICDALAVADDERSELYATAPLEEAQASSSKSIDLSGRRVRLEQLPSGAKGSADDEYRFARRRWLEQLRSECGSEAEFEMAKSREHWTVVGEPSSELDLTLVANREHFQRLLDQDHKRKVREGLFSKMRRKFYGTDGCRPDFFKEFDDGELVVGEKIGEGGQAEIFKASLRGNDEYVLKVFKPDIPLVHLERNWTIQVSPSLQVPDIFYYSEALLPHCCVMESGTLLKDGRFAFTMKRYWGDLRKLIDQYMMTNSKLSPPFSPHEAFRIIYWIAVGMRQLHGWNILHRDLKASNVLVKRLLIGIYFYHVADFECSGGVRGTGFWRAPEVLQLVKDKVRDPNVWEKMWSKKVDVYSYAMTAYEVLTGGIPLDHLGPIDYDGVVLRGERPLLPDYIDPRIQELLCQCWHSDPSQRPSFDDIVWKVKTIYPFEEGLIC